MPDLKKTLIPDEMKKDWTWNHRSWPTGYQYFGVHTFDDCLTWYEENYPGFAGGFSFQQSIDDFFDNGPAMRDVPPEILDNIRETLLPLMKN